MTTSEPPLAGRCDAFAVAGDSCWLTPDWTLPQGVAARQTLRGGGVSVPPYDSLNLGDHVGDQPQSVAENWCRVSVGLPGEPIRLAQVHGISVVDAATVQGRVEADACFTRQPGVVCSIMTADCLPVLFCADDGSAVAAAHAGWRGLQAGVLEATVAALALPPERLWCWLGPAIGPAAFEVGEEVRVAFVQDCPADAQAFRPGLQPGKWYADIFQLARLRLQRAGLRRIAGGGICTVSDPARFFSYRRDGVTGRMATMIWIDP
jgi:YfiH family protein